MAPGPTFLDLPENVRFRIYRLSDLIRPCPIDLTPYQQSSVQFPDRGEYGARDECYHELRKSGNNILGGSYRDCVCPRIPTELLLISKAVYKDAQAALYGKNRFVLRAHKAADLAAIGTLVEANPHIISAMTSLLIRLNCWLCPWGHDEIAPLRGTSTEKICYICSAPIAESDPVLDTNTESGKEMAEFWVWLCSDLAPYVKPGQLDLTFICDTQSQLVAEQITSSLMKLPHLKKCTIRLGRTKNPILNTIAREVSQKMTQEYIPQNKFPWDRLPRELRLQILNYTHLGALGTYAPKFSILRIENNKLLLGQSEQIDRPMCCQKCTHTYADCCCPTAYPSYSTTCICRDTPFSLFAVSKQMYLDCTEVFFSKNAFEFSQDPLSTISFLKSLPAHKLFSIHRLRFRFSEEQLDDVWEQDNWAEKWSKMTTFMNQNMNIPKLEIEIDLSVAFELFIFNDDNSNLDHDLRFVDDMYFHIASTLSTLKSLQGVSFDLGWWLDLRPLLEKKVMGDRWNGDLGGSEGGSEKQLDAPRWRWEELRELGVKRSERSDRWLGSLAMNQV